MKGAIFYASKYGSTAEYASWIEEATGLPVFNVEDKNADPSHYDFLVLGTPVIYYKLLNRKWIRAKWKVIKNKPIILFTVSGAGAGDKLNAWIANSKLPENLISRVPHVALRGRQIPKELTWFDRLMLIIAGLKNPDPVAKQEELKGFDYMDKFSIQPIVELIGKLQSETVLA